MKFVLFFAVTSLFGYILGYIVGKYTAEQELEEKRSQLGLDYEDEQDEWDRIFNGGNK